MKKTLLMLAAVLLLSPIFAQRDRGRNEAAGGVPSNTSFLTESAYKDYIPVSPIEFEYKVALYNTQSKKFDSLFIKQFAYDKSTVMQFLSNEAVYSTVRKNDSSVDVKYGSAAITAEPGLYTVTLDYSKYTTVKATMGENGSSAACSGFIKIGVGMRVTAQITTFQPGVDVSSLFGLAAAVKAGKLSGQLSIDLMGIESGQLTDLISLPVDISESGIQSVLQTLATVKAKIYDEGTRLYPQILAIKRSAGNCSVFDIINNLDQTGQTTIKTTGQ